MPNYITRKRFEEIQQDIRRIRGKDLPEVAKAKKDAAAEGDLKENAGYHGAKERMELLMTKLNDLEELVSDPVFIEDLNINTGRVTIGTTVKVQDKGAGKDTEYAIMGPADADPDNHIISFLTPIARGLMLKRAGEECVIDTPGGKLEVKILEIKKFACA